MTAPVFNRGVAPCAKRLAGVAWRLAGLTLIAACTRGEAASVPEPAMQSDVSLTLASFEPPPGTYDAVMAQRGKVYFVENCAQCHVKPQSATPRPAATRYVRLRNLGQDTTFFADGSAKTLDAVVQHYDETLKLHLTKTQQRELVEYLKSH